LVETGVPQGTARAREKVEGISRALKLREIRKKRDTDSDTTTNSETSSV
jgi:hypothetical protein